MLLLRWVREVKTARPDGIHRTAGAPSGGLLCGVVEDLGPPIAYTLLEEGTPVYDRDGERIGVIDDVLADFTLDIFEGVIVHTRPLPGKHRYADVDQIAKMHERGIVLSVARAELREPPDRSDRDDEGDAKLENPVESGFRRAWDWLTGWRR
jgi:PRC-barrel domain protein